MRTPLVGCGAFLIADAGQRLRDGASAACHRRGLCGARPDPSPSFASCRPISTRPVPAARRVERIARPRLDILRGRLNTHRVGRGRRRGRGQAFTRLRAARSALWRCQSAHLVRIRALCSVPPVLGSGVELCSRAAGELAGPCSVDSVSWSPVEKTQMLLASAGDDGLVKVWRFEPS